MIYYDHFSANPHAKMTKIGSMLVTYRNRWFIKKILRFLPSGGQVLEIGPGKGGFARACHEKKITYQAVEANKALAEELRKEGFSVKTGAVPPIPMEGLFDVVFMDQVLEHMPNAKTTLELLESCHLRLKKNGKLIIAAPDYSIFKEDFFNCDYSHEFPVSTERLRQILEDSGFNIIEIGYFTLTLNGYIPCLIAAIIAKVAWKTGMLSLFFGSRAYKIKISTLPSVYAIAVKK